MRLPIVPYREALAMQHRAAADLRSGGPESLIVLAHPPVVTLGRSADPANVVASPERLASLGVEVVRTQRGGQVTYHSPGQVVAYPILDLTRRRIGAHAYVARLLAATAEVVRSFGIETACVPDVIGVFASVPGGPPAKIAALGVSISHGVTGHGVAVNVEVDLAGYSLIVPCGLHDFGVTSMHMLLLSPPSPVQVASRLVESIRAAFGRDLRLIQDPPHQGAAQG